MLETKPSVEPLHDENPQETSEWLEALEQIVEEEGPERASFLLKRLLERGANYGVTAPLSVNTPYLNTIPADAEEPYPGDREIERRIKSIIRWNAMAMVVRANKYDPGIGGHISTFRLRCSLRASDSATSGDPDISINYLTYHDHFGLRRLVALLRPFAGVHRISIFRSSVIFIFAEYADIPCQF